MMMNVFTMNEENYRIIIKIKYQSIREYEMCSHIYQAIHNAHAYIHIDAYP